MSRSGAGGYIAVGKETTYGTAAARTHWCRTVQSMSIQQEIVHEPISPLGVPGLAAPNVEAMYVSADNVGGSFTFALGWEDGTPVLLEHMFGVVATTGSGPYVHTFRMNTYNDDDPSITIEQVFGARGPAARAQVYEGCVAESWEISCDAGGMLIASVTEIGEAAAGMSTPTAPDFFSGGGWFYHNHLATKTYNGNDLGSILSLRIRCNGRATRRPQLGSLHTGRPMPGGLLELEVEMVVRWDANDPITAFRAGTVAPLILTFNNGSGKIIGFTADKAQIMSIGNAVSNAGPVDLTITMKLLADDTEVGLRCALTNAQATHDIVPA